MISKPHKRPLLTLQGRAYALLFIFLGLIFSSAPALAITQANCNYPNAEWVWSAAAPGDYSINLRDVAACYLPGRIISMSAQAQTTAAQNVRIDGSCVKFTATSVSASILETMVNVTVKGVNSTHVIGILFRNNFSPSSVHTPAFSTNCPALPEPNRAPQANPAQASVLEDQQLRFDLTKFATDLDGDALTFTIFAPPKNGRASFEGPVLIYTPNTGFSGTDVLQYAVSDGQGGNANAQVSITVSHVNHPPALYTNPTHRKTAAGVALDIPLNELAYDPDGDLLAVIIASNPSKGQAMVITGTGSTAIRYTPPAEYIGPDQFSYYVTDPSNTSTAVGTIVIDVSKVNTAPRAENRTANTTGGQPVSINLANAVVDADKDPLSITVPDKTTHGSLSVTGLVVTYTPNPNYVGDDSFQYTVHDGFGGSATATVNLRVTGVTPQAATALNFTVQGGDTQSARLNGTASVSVQVKDEANQPLPGLLIRWNVMDIRTAAQVVLTTQDTATDGSGSVRASFPTASAPTTYAVTVTATELNTGLSASKTFAVATGLNLITRPNTPEFALATALDVMCPKLQDLGEGLTQLQQQLIARCNEIFAAATDGNDTQILAALRALAPDEAAAQGRMSNSFAQQQLSNIGARLAALRSGATGLGLTGLSFNIKGRSVPGSVFAPAAAEPGSTASVDLPQSVPKWSGFISGTVGGGDKSLTGSEAGFDFHTRGLTAGADYRYSSATVLGGALGYARSDVNLDANGGGLDAKARSFSLYGTYYHTQNFYLDAVLNYASNSYDQTRNIDYTVGSTHIQKTARSDTGGALLALSVGGGYEFTARNGASSEISLRLHRLASSINGYTETGADALNLALDSQSIRVLASSLGTRGSWPLSLKWGVLIPQLDLNWEHELSGGAHQIQGSFVNDPFATPFAFKTDAPDRDYFQLGLGASAILPGGKTAFVQYQTTLGRDHYRDYNVALGARVELR